MLQIADHNTGMMEAERERFQHDTFGNEAFWSGALRLHEAIAGEDCGGLGPGLTPEAALVQGLKVDTEALPQEVLDALAHGQIDLQDPAVTLALLQADAVVGFKGTFTGDELTAAGVTCALRHSTVDGTFDPGLGKRLGGWANRALNVGAILALAPDVSAIAGLLDKALSSILASTMSQSFLSRPGRGSGIAGGP